MITAGGVTRTTTETGERTLTSTIAYRHENYNDNTLVNDIAVIKLPSALTLSNLIKFVLNQIFLSRASSFCQSTLIIIIVIYPKICTSML